MVIYKRSTQQYGAIAKIPTLYKHFFYKKYKAVLISVH